MDNFDKVYSYLTEEEGLSPEDATRAMVMMVEQGFDPTQVFLGGLAKMLEFLPQKKPAEERVTTPRQKVKKPEMAKPIRDPWNQFPKKPQPQRGLPKPESSRLPTRLLPPAKPIPTPNQTQGMLGSRSVPNIQQVSAKYGLDTPAPKPQFGPGSTKPIGPNPARNIFNLPPADAGIKARTALNTPKPTFNASSVVKGALNPKTLGGRLGFAGMALGAVDQARKVFNPKDNLFTSLRDLATTVSHGGQIGPGHSRYRAPESDPALPRTPKSQPVQKAVEPVKAEPVKREAPKLSAAAKDFDKTFAAARAAGEKEFTWRGKRYNTKYKGE